MSGLQPVNGDAVFLVAHLDGKILLGSLKDFVWSVVWGLKGGLAEVFADENELRLVQTVWYVRLGLTVCAGGNWSKIADLFSKLAEVLVDRCLWSLLDEVAGNRQGSAVDQVRWRGV